MFNFSQQFLTVNLKTLYNTLYNNITSHKKFFTQQKHYCDTMETSHTNPVNAGLSAELMGTGSTEVIIRPERLVQGGDKVEQGLPATLIT